MRSIFLLLLAACPVFSADVPIGFVSHYPLIKHNDESLKLTGANVNIVRVPWGLIEPQEDKFDFTMLDEQLQWAERNNQKLVYLLEAGPAHAVGVAWLIDKLQASGECMGNPEGVQLRDPSPLSPMYRKYLTHYIENVVTYLKNHPLSHCIYGYNNGCEWWFPMSSSYGKMEHEGFRKYLQTKYSTIDNLNEIWGTEYIDWDVINPPVLINEGNNYLPQGALVPPSAQLDTSFCDTTEGRIAVSPGEKYTFTVDLTAEAPGGTGLQIAWFNPDQPNPVSVFPGPQTKGNGQPQQLTCTVTAPANATTVWLHIKLFGNGKVNLHRCSFTDEAGNELVANPDLDPAAGGWTFVTWTVGEKEKLETGWTKSGDAWMNYTPDGLLASGAKWPLAEVTDWCKFRSETMAQMLQFFASEIKKVDPDRPVITYLTFAFANAFEWDYTYQMAIENDTVAHFGKDIDILGMQLSSTNGDTDSVTCSLDMIRKTGKPMWAIDLLDFTKGTALGTEGLIDLGASVFRHGGTGIQYYCWWGTPVYNYYDLGISGMTEMISKTREIGESYRSNPPVASTALVMPRMPLYRFLPEAPNDWADFMGWYKLLLSKNIIPDVWTLDELVQIPAGRYHNIIIPDCAYISVDALNSLIKAQQAGANIITSGRFAKCDMTGRAIAQAQLPVIFKQFEEPVGTAYLGETWRAPSPTDTPARLGCQPGSPKPEAVTAEVWDLLDEMD